jgi:hypothetical protein
MLADPRVVMDISLSFFGRLQLVEGITDRSVLVRCYESCASVPAMKPTFPIKVRSLKLLWGLC